MFSVIRDIFLTTSISIVNLLKRLISKLLFVFCSENKNNIFFEIGFQFIISEFWLFINKLISYWIII